MVTIGILALQGDFAAHKRALCNTGASAQEVRTSDELNRCDGLVIPGGESTTMLTLLGAEKLLEPLRAFGEYKPIYGTCAGTILLAKAVSHPSQVSLDLLDIDVQRNAYGRQIDSRIACLDTARGEVEAVFIRAPIVRRTGVGVRVLAKYLGDPVWIEQGLHMATTFHPELSKSIEVHRYFAEKVAFSKSPNQHTSPPLPIAS